MGHVSSADVPAFDAETSTIHAEETPAAAIRRHGSFRRDTAGDPGVRGSPHAVRVYAQDGRSYPRCLERDSTDCGEVGTHQGESCAWRTICPRFGVSGRSRRGATSQAAALLTALSPLPRTMVGLAVLSGLRRGELFALRWKDIDEQKRLLTVREAVYDEHIQCAQNRSRIATDSAVAARVAVARGLENSGGEHGAGCDGVRHTSGDAHSAEQCAATSDLPRV